MEPLSRSNSTYKTPLTNSQLETVRPLVHRWKNLTPAAENFLRDRLVLALVVQDVLELGIACGALGRRTAKRSNHDNSCKLIPLEAIDWLGPYRIHFAASVRFG